MTEDEKDKAVCTLMDRIGSAVERAVIAWELRCKAAATKDTVDTEARQISYELLIKHLPKLLAFLDTKDVPESSSP